MIAFTSLLIVSVCIFAHHDLEILLQDLLEYGRSQRALVRDQGHFARRFGDLPFSVHFLLGFDFVRPDTEAQRRRPPTHVGLVMLYALRSAEDPHVYQFRVVFHRTAHYLFVIVVDCVTIKHRRMIAAKLPHLESGNVGGFQRRVQVLGVPVPLHVAFLGLLAHEARRVELPCAGIGLARRYEVGYGAALPACVCVPIVFAHCFRVVLWWSCSTSAHQEMRGDVLIYVLYELAPCLRAPVEIMVVLSARNTMRL